ncbi:MAG: tetratricopeptide repeat protein, partial [Bacteroidota bacterium]
VWEVLASGGRGRRGNRNFETALEHQKEALKYDKQFSEAYYDLGIIYYSISDYSKAIKNTLKAIEGGYRKSKVYYILGLAYEKKKNWVHASNAFKNTIAIEDGFINAYLPFVNCLVKEKKYKQGIDLLNTYADIFPLSIDADFFYLSGICHLGMEETNQAEDFFKQCISEDMECSLAYYGLSICSVLKGDLSNALILMEKAFKKGNIHWENIKNDGFIASIKSEKKFKELVNKYLK